MQPAARCSGRAFSISLWLMPVRDRIDLGHDPRRGQQRILAQAHRRRARMRILSGDDHIVPAQAQCTDHHPEHLVFILEDGPLLDVRFEAGGDRATADRFRAGVADGVRGLAHADTIEVGLLQLLSWSMG